jgi:hypothetical protein
MGALGSNDLPISIATMLSRLAAKAQSRIRAVNLPSAFHLRQPAFIRAGVRITPATKHKLEAEVYDRDEFMVAQEDSGLKYPKYHNFIAIPLRGARPTIQALIAKNNMPHAVMEAGGFIHNNIMYKRSSRALHRPKRGAEGPSMRGVLPMYYLVDHWKWQPKLNFRPTVISLVNQEYEAEFRKAFEQYSRR